MKLSRTLTLAFATTSIAALALTGCASSPGASSPSSSSSTVSESAPAEYRVGVVAPDIAFAAFYAATGPTGTLTKLFEENDVKLTVQVIPSGTNLVAALQGGSIDAALVSGSIVMSVQAQGGAIVPLMNMFDGPAQIVLGAADHEDSLGTGVSKFDGMRWAFTRVGSISEVTAKETAEGAGLDWAAQTQVPLGSGSETQAVLESNRADIVSVNPSAAAKAIETGVGYVIDNPQDDDKNALAYQLSSTYATTPAFASKYPDFTQSVTTAIVAQLISLSEAESADEVLETMPADFVTATSETWETQWDLAKSGIVRASGGFTDEEVDQTLAGAQLVAGLPAGYILPADLFSNALVLEAFSSLGVDPPKGLE